MADAKTPRHIEYHGSVTGRFTSLHPNLGQVPLPLSPDDRATVEAIKAACLKSVKGDQ